MLCGMERSGVSERRDRGQGLRVRFGEVLTFRAQKMHESSMHLWVVS